MTPTQKRLRDLRDRQSRERGTMAQLSPVDELSDEQRSELDTIERGTPDLERQLRAATIAAEDEEREQRRRRRCAPAGGQRGNARAGRTSQQGQARWIHRGRDRTAIGGRSRGRVRRRAWHRRESLPARIARAARTARGPRRNPRHGRRGHDDHAAPLARPAVRRHGRRACRRHDGVGSGWLGELPRDHGRRQRGSAGALD